MNKKIITDKEWNEKAGVNMSKRVENVYKEVFKTKRELKKFLTNKKRRSVIDRLYDI